MRLRRAENRGDEEPFSAPDAPVDRFFELSRDLLCIANFDGLFVRINPAWEDTLGLTEETLVARPFLDFVHPDDRARTAAETASLATAGTDTVNFENRYRAKDGRWRWLQWTARATPEDQLIYAVARDVTAQKRAADAVAQLASIVESTDDAVLTKRLTGVVTSWNRGAAALYGYSAEEMIGMPVATIIPPERAGEDQKFLTRVLQGELIDHYETERLRKDGARVAVSVTVSPIRNERGEIVGASTIARDITERRRSERAREEAERRFRAVFEEAPIGMAVVDPAGKFVDVNWSLLDALAQSREVLMRTTIESCVEPSSVQAVKECFKELLAAATDRDVDDQRHAARSGWSCAGYPQCVAHTRRRRSAASFRVSGSAGPRRRRVAHPGHFASVRLSV